MTMDTDDMMLVGSSPPTHRGYTPTPGSARPQSATRSVSSAVLDGYFNQNARPTTGQGINRTIHSKNRNITHGFGSGVNGHDTHTSSRESEANWQQPRWGSTAANNQALEKATRYYNDQHKPTSSAPKTPINQTMIHNTERAQSRASTGKDLERSRPSSARKTVFKPSYCDEMLFGKPLAAPDFSAPWQGRTKQKKGHPFDYTDYTQKANATKQQSRPSSARSKVPRHSASYVDESLFGPKPVDPGWEAPWSKPDPKNINVFDAFQHKVTIKHNDVDVLRPKSSIYLRKPRPQSSGKPVWK